MMMVSCTKTEHVREAFLVMLEGGWTRDIKDDLRRSRGGAFSEEKIRRRTAGLAML
jgi:hypothetical protein